eukprot:jgi/Mesvir1/10708/Mv13794-RA.1
MATITGTSARAHTAIHVYTNMSPTTATSAGSSTSASTSTSVSTHAIKGTFASAHPIAATRPSEGAMPPRQPTTTPAPSPATRSRTGRSTTKWHARSSEWLVALLAVITLLPPSHLVAHAHFFESHDKETVARGHPVEPIVGRLAGALSDEFVYTSPPPTPQCHAGTLAEAADRTIVASWFGGTHERHVDVGIWVSRLEPGKKVWSTPVEVANGAHMSHGRQPSWNPVLFQVPGKGAPLLLFYKIGTTPRAWKGYMRMSFDNGVTWGKQIALPPTVYGPSKNKPVLLGDGTLLVPSSDEATYWEAHLETTTDLKTWQRSVPLNKRSVKAIQPTLLVGGADGRSITLLARTESQGIVKAMSTDGGFSFTPMVFSGLPNPNSGIDAVTLADGRHLLIYNHAIKRNRFPLNLAISDDMGVSWRAVGVLEHGDKDSGEFSYPAIIQARDGTVHILYTWHRLRMRHVAIDVKKMKAGKPIVGGKWPL